MRQKRKILHLSLGSSKHKLQHMQLLTCLLTSFIAPCKRIRVPPEAGKIFACGGVRDPAPGLWNPEYSSSNQESKFHLQRILNTKPLIQNHWRKIQSPRLSWIPLHRALGWNPIWKGRGCSSKFGMKPLKETNLGVAQPFLTPNWAILLNFNYMNLVNKRNWKCIIF